MILLDSSVVIEYLQTGDPKLFGLFQAHQAAICGVTRAEVLNGARSSKHRTRLVLALNAFHPLATPESAWDDVGDNLGLLRSRGVTVPLADVIIVTLAILNDIELWARDAHFQLIQTVLPQLKLFQEPP